MNKKEIILDFIKGRLSQKGLTFEFNKSTQSKDTFFRYFAKEGEKNHVFTVMKNDEKNINDWYKKSHFDNSMNKSRKEEVLKENPIDKAVEEYFKQTFDINGESYLFRWS